MPEDELPLRRRILFIYLGRRGVLGRLTLDLARELDGSNEIAAFFALSNQNKAIREFAWLGPALLGLDTFARVLSPAHPLNFWRSRRRLLAFISEHRISHVVTLMPHIWTPVLAPALRARGLHYTTIIHDAVSHPGDPTAAVTPWLRREAGFADDVVALSASVGRTLVEGGHAPLSRIRTLFVPDLNYGALSAPRRRDRAQPLRLLFFGRILAYKGLPLLVDAVERLHADGLQIHLGVAGDGDISELRNRLEAIGAEIVNRWLDDCELAPLLARYDAVALPHIEASQSGVAAVAFANCMPVIAMRSGGLEDQVTDGQTGVLADSVTGEALAIAIKRLDMTPELYESISASLFDHAQHRSIAAFARALTTFPMPSRMDSP